MVVDRRGGHYEKEWEEEEAKEGRDRDEERKDKGGGELRKENRGDIRV